MTMVVGSLAARDYKGVGNQYVNEGKVVVEAYTKGKRPQTATDDETWDENRPAPTLNAFDQGDTRATTIIVQEPVLLTMREGKPGGGKGPLLSTDKSLSLSTSNEQLLFQPAEEPVLLDGTRVDDVRVYDPPVQTLKSRMGTGGNNVPVIGFSHTQGLSAQPSEDAWPTLRTEGNGMAVAIPTQQAANDVVGCLRSGGDGGVPSSRGEHLVIAYDEYNDSLGGEVHHALRAGTKQSTGVMLFQDSEFGVKEYDTAGTLRAGRIPEHQMVGVEAAGFKAGQGAGAGGIGYQEGTSQTLTSQMNGIEPTVLTPTMAVRRLTPLECERLMGWPDDWTAGQSDTHRYKQCGNGVASPVAQWIAQQLLQLDQ
ncbi:MAG: hypothetical protein EBZ61_08865 [Micrococcales bacterium]|nr:hypothetical protein [Micrococcales bacterium]